MNVVRGGQRLAFADRRRFLSWVMNNLNYLGLFMIVLMIVLLVWRTFRCKPINAVEGLIGTVCLACLVAPVMFNMSYETFGRKLNSEVSAMTRQLRFIEDIGQDIERGLTQLDPAFAGIFDWTWSDGARRGSDTLVSAAQIAFEADEPNQVLVYYLSQQLPDAKRTLGNGNDGSASRRWRNISKSAD